MRRTWASSLLVFLVVAAAGCGSHHAVSVTAAPPSSLADEPVDGDAAHDVYLTAPEATHEQTAFLVPDLPGLVAGNANVPGVVAAARDRERIWPQLLRFLGATP